MAKSYDAIIIGAGIIGCATSLALGRKGWKVLNLDRLPAKGFGTIEFGMTDERRNALIAAGRAATRSCGAWSTGGP